MQLKFLKISFLFFIFFTSTWSQEIPPINVFSKEIYGAQNQNWAISQASNKFIYVANNQGLLEYNGATWQLYHTPNETIMRSVKCFDNKIFTGFYMDFGFWTKNNFGTLEYTSIVKENNIKMLEDEQVWEILELNGWLLFKSLKRIYLYNLENKSLKIIDATNEITKLSKVGSTIYFQEINSGIFMIENGTSKLISDHPVLKENRIINIFLKDDNLMFLTQKKGFHYLEKDKLIKWDITSNNFLSNKTIYSAIQLKNGGSVLGSISNGFIYLSEKGDLLYQITQELGLINNTVLSVFEDIDNNVWLGLDDGINSINLASAFRIFVKKNNFWGTIYTSKVYDNYLYLGTNQGLFFKELNSKNPFKFIEGTQGQVWNLTNIDNTLFSGQDTGTFLVKKNKATKIIDVRGAWGFVKKNENTIIQGNYDGLYVLFKENNQWNLKNKIEGFSTPSRYFVLKGNNEIFVNHEYKGVYKLEIDKDFKKVLKVTMDSSVEKGIHSSLIKYNNKILYASKKGVYTYVNNKDAFVLDSVYSKLISKDKFLSAKLIFDSEKNKLWSFSKNDIKYLTPGKLSNKPILYSIPISNSIGKGASGYENSIHLENNKQLIGASNGYLTIDLNTLKTPKDFSVTLDKVESFQVDNPNRKLDLSEKIELHNKENNVKFYYSVANYDKIIDTKYQYLLLGLNKQWSEPSNSSFILFDNIPSGKYTFKVRGIVGGKLSKNEATFNFVISKPWYFSNLMMFIYSLWVLLVLYVLHLSSKQYYKKQREKLLEKAQRESELKELESSQEIVKLNNEKLRNDIQSKNRELATSTMNLIKKNEFLNTIKKELITGGEKNLTKVVKIIDKNLNNTDDWKMFQEAFNNADKKFLKKVKTKHPELTPNDLRLCAYLRLNLSSKEIAPLLNISPRSVEVKRYRLRKKMNLPHDSNLTNYILEI